VLVYVICPDIEAALGRAEAKAGKTIAPKMAIGDYGFIGILEDSKGNRIGLHSMK
jgi:hypothetical protein